MDKNFFQKLESAAALLTAFLCCDGVWGAVFRVVDPRLGPFTLTEELLPHLTPVLFAALLTALWGAAVILETLSFTLTFSKLKDDFTSWLPWDSTLLRRYRSLRNRVVEKLRKEGGCTDPMEILISPKPYGLNDYALYQILSAKLKEKGENAVPAAATVGLSFTLLSFVTALCYLNLSGLSPVPQALLLQFWAALTVTLTAVEEPVIPVEALFTVVAVAFVFFAATAFLTRTAYPLGASAILLSTLAWLTTVILSAERLTVRNLKLMVRYCFGYNSPKPQQEV